MKERKVPMRRCIGCMTSKEKHELIRIARYEGRITLDESGRAKGRGAYLCRHSKSCWEKAYKKKALERSLGTTIDEEQKRELFAQLEQQDER